MSDNPPPMSLDVGLSGDTYVVRLSGEFNREACGEVERALRTAEQSAATQILLDLDRLTSLDASGLHAILSAGRRSATDGDRLRVTRGQGQVANVFRLTSLSRTLPLVDVRAARVLPS